jgi:hypothetical protein
MALKQVAARIEGDVFQGMVFWLHAAMLLRPSSKVARVTIENDQAAGVDDVSVFYRAPGGNVTRKKKPTTSLLRSSAAEYLTFVAASGTWHGRQRASLRPSSRDALDSRPIGATLIETNGPVAFWNGSKRFWTIGSLVQDVRILWEK